MVIQTQSSHSHYSFFPFLSPWTFVELTQGCWQGVFNISLDGVEKLTSIDLLLTNVLLKRHIIIILIMIIKK